MRERDFDAEIQRKPEEISDLTHPRVLQISFKSEWGSFYFNRLCNLIEKRQQIDCGLYRMSEYWKSGYSEQLPFRRNYSNLEYSQMRGLRYGILYAIMDTAIELARLEPDQPELSQSVIDFDRHRARITPRGMTIDKVLHQIENKVDKEEKEKKAT